MSVLLLNVLTLSIFLDTSSLAQRGQHLPRPLQRVARPSPCPEALALGVADAPETHVLHATEDLPMPKTALRHHHLVDVPESRALDLTELEIPYLADTHELHRQLTHKSLLSRYRPHDRTSATLPCQAPQTARDMNKTSRQTRRGYGNPKRPCSHIP